VAESLPSVVRDAERRWSLRVGQSFQPGGTCSWVAPAVGMDGAPVVLKVAWHHEEGRHEADGLVVWNGVGIVRLLAVERLASCDVMLLEACSPGTPLSAEPATEQDEVLGALLARLWIEPPAGHPFRALAEMCDAWTDEYEERYARAEPALRLDRGLSRSGIELFRALPRSAPRSCLVTTDLHAGNVLAAQREPWLAIDPKPHVGDPSYDVLQHMLNHPDRLASDPGGFAARMAALSGLDGERVQQWLFARCVQESFTLPGAREGAVALSVLLA
jgi:streptomycin 6-kinase